MCLGHIHSLHKDLLSLLVREAQDLNWLNQAVLAPEIDDRSERLNLGTCFQYDHNRDQYGELAPPRSFPARPNRQ